LLYCIEPTGNRLTGEKFIPPDKGRREQVSLRRFYSPGYRAIQHAEAGFHHAVTSGVDVRVCTPVKPTGIHAIVLALATVARLSAIAIRTLAPGIRLPAVSVGARPSAVHLIGTPVGAIPPAKPFFSSIRRRTASVVCLTTVRVRTPVTAVGIPAPCVLTLVTIIGIPAFRARALVVII